MLYSIILLDNYMIIDLKKYVLTNLSQIRTYIDDIKNMKLDIIMINEDNILSFIPYEKIENILFPIENIEYVKKSLLYIDKSLINIIEKQVIIDLNKQHADIHDINIFYSLYKNCKFNINNEYYNKHFDRLISIRNIERIDYLKQSFDKLKLFLTQNKVNVELARLIGDILTDIGIIERLNLIFHLNYIKQNNISDLKNYQNVKKDDLLFADIIGTIVSMLEKEYDDSDVYNNITTFTDDNVICHSNRVFIMMVEFLYFYNEEISRGVASKLRVDYKKKYYDYYYEIGKKYNLLTKADRIEDISKVGFRKIEQNEIKYYARAAFWHDIALVDILPNVPIVSNNEGDTHSILGFNLLKY